MNNIQFEPSFQDEYSNAVDIDYGELIGLTISAIGSAAKANADKKAAEEKRKQALIEQQTQMRLEQQRIAQEKKDRLAAAHPAKAPSNNKSTSKTGMYVTIAVMGTVIVFGSGFLLYLKFKAK
ncbi:MAG: hypothetical protein JWO44_629 [Bacteroidetes bacterium]|nr:hypothetical protein [Bacteroidota bacterium]